MSYMSEEGYKKLLADLKELEAKRPEVVRQIAEARDKGDLSENAEYDAAKEAQGLLEMRINELKLVIADAKIIDTTKLNTETVQVLTKVGLKNTKTGAAMQYTIVPESEANLREAKISINTPIAKGLLGKKVGDLAEITVPQGKLFLAYMSEQEQENILKRTELREYTQHTITSLASLRKEFETVRNQGYAIENGEYKKGLRSVAAPIFDQEGKVRYAIGIIGMFRQIESEQFVRAISVVKETAQKITDAL